MKDDTAYERDTYVMIQVGEGESAQVLRLAKIFAIVPGFGGMLEFLG